MKGPSTILRDLTTGKEQVFNYDYSFWSFDEESHPTPADQSTLQAELGSIVLNNAFEGYNTCLFAYGQTGSGKSYSMTGIPESPGIMPQSMEKLFARVRLLHSDGRMYTPLLLCFMPSLLLCTCVASFFLMTLMVVRGASPHPCTRLPLFLTLLERVFRLTPAGGTPLGGSLLCLVACSSSVLHSCPPRWRLHHTLMLCAC